MTRLCRPDPDLAALFPMISGEDTGARARHAHPVSIWSRILCWHAGFLMTLTPIMTLGAHVGPFNGAGRYGGLAENPMAVAGLAQACPLMGLVAVAVRMGAQVQACTSR